MFTRAIALRPMEIQPNLLARHRSLDDTPVAIQIPADRVEQLEVRRR